MNKSKFKIIGNIITIISLIFLSYRFIKADIDYSIVFQKLHILWFIGTCIAYTLLLSVISPYPWCQILNAICGSKIPYLSIQRVLAKANLMKYIPGNVFQFVGRNAIAVEYSLSHKMVALSTVIDTFINVVGVLVVCVLCYVQGLKAGIEQLNKYILPIYYIIAIVVFAVVMLGMVLLIYKEREKICKLITILISKKSIFAYIKSILVYIILSFSSGVIYWIVLFKIVEANVSIDMFLKVVAGYLIAWFFGFIVPGAPGGIGIRETVITILLGTIINSNDVMLAIVIYRIVNIIGDVGYWVISSVVSKVKPH